MIDPDTTIRPSILYARTPVDLSGAEIASSCLAGIDAPCYPTPGLDRARGDAEPAVGDAAP
ncbi:hypothetical protein NFI95_00955 [Acetobacteraceae bacterium KSS8]|uniref:Uncharacterized protein n=1 Tax=Endosaccharibacter trunci TaxID=2812733 RepID=A0ABT1W2D8_9PROT|nr:hypothetical protein [Acetobacteraceae bacterium KSS8]